MIQIHNGELVDGGIVSYKYGGGNNFNVAEDWDEVSEREELEHIEIESVENNQGYWEIPIGEGYSIYGRGTAAYGIWGQSGFSYWWGSLPTWQSPFRKMGEFEPTFPMQYWFAYDEKALELAGTTQEAASPTNSRLAEIQHRWINLFIDRDVEENFDMLCWHTGDEDLRTYSRVWVHFGDDNPRFFWFNVAFAKLKGSKLLYSVYNGETYLAEKDKFDSYRNNVVGYGLKNFRLRELKKLSKAKK